MRRSRFCAVAICAAAISASAAAQTADVFHDLRWRLVGPFRGGRTVTATGVPGHPDRFYLGAVGGGVWRSDNAGRTWTPIFDAQPVASIGAVAVAPSNPDVVYVGSGEADMRSDISYGNGMYKSIDGGATWTPIGLNDSRQIAQIVVDPRDPRVVFVAALGHAYGPSKERGVYRSKDGGATWKAVLVKDENTGAADLAIDATDGKTVLASLWQTRRPPWNVYPPSNGPGSGLYRSIDGGDTWKPVTAGLPAEGLGRIRVAFAPSKPRRAYALVDAKAGGLFVSDDAGTTWTRASSDRRIWERGWYFGGVTVDPKDADTLYACDTALYRSVDGGKTFVPFKGAPGGDDYHRLWIDPSDSRRMIVASDQGAVVSVDGGATWSSWYNQPTAQFYHVATDDRFPYWIYGAQQDSGAAATPVRTDYRSITQRDWNEIAAGGESGYLLPDPKDKNVVWGGTVGRFDWTTLQDQDVDPTRAHPDEYRGEWTLPLAIAPRDPKSVYFARQFLFRTRDDGAHWEKISPDLTREAPAVPPTLDPVTAADSDVKGPRRGVIYAIGLSPVADDLIWCGTDDGLIWISRDGAKTWKDVTPKSLGPWSKVGILEPSHFDAETVYAAIDRHRLDDLRAEILRTHDGGATWTSIAQGIPEGSYVNVVREDPVRRGVLYAGTETGVFVSFDDGARWQPLRMNLPNCSIRDIDVRHGDLVVATHGRAFWVLDDLSPLREVDAAFLANELALVPPRPAVRLHAAPFQGSPEPKDEPMAENPRAGAVIDYFVKSDVPSPLTIEILNAAGTTMRRYASDDKRETPDPQKIVVTSDWVPAPAPPPAAAGLHRFVWDLRATLPEALVSSSGFRRESGLLVPPGAYTVRLSAGGRSVTQPLAVVRDPRLRSSVADGDLARAYHAAHEVQGMRVPVAEALHQADTLSKKIAAIRDTAPDAVRGAIDAFAKTILTVAGPPPGAADESAPDSPSLRKIASSLAGVQGAIDSADAAPTADALTASVQCKPLARGALERWQAVLNDDLARLNERLHAAGLAVLTP